MNWYLQALKKYTVFIGRARRKEYWMFVLFNIIISAALSIVDYFTGTSLPEDRPADRAGSRHLMRRPSVTTEHRAYT